MPPQTRRTMGQRVKRLALHPVRTIREARINRQNGDWQVYFEAAKRIGSSEKNAREFANQLSGKAIIRSRIRELVKPTLHPYAKLIRRRQILKERLLKWQAEQDRLHAQNNRLYETSIRIRNGISERKYEQMLAREERLVGKIFDAKEELNGIVERLKQLTGKQ